jgi:putative DNA methylase
MVNTVFKDGNWVKVEEEIEQGIIELGAPAPGITVLDRLHQAMLLFSDGKGDALKRFLTEEIGQDQNLWKLAQALSALYPSGSDEKRWVDGVLARKKGLGL